MTSPGVISVTVDLNNEVRRVVFQLNETADVTDCLVNPANFKIINTGGVGSTWLDLLLSIMAMELQLLCK